MGCHGQPGSRSLDHFTKTLGSVVGDGWMQGPSCALAPLLELVGLAVAEVAEGKMANGEWSVGER